MAFPLHHSHKSCRWLVAYTDREKIAPVKQSNKQSQRHVTSRTSKMFRRHLKCSLPARRRAATSFGFFVSFYSASRLSLGDLVQRCLGQPVDLLALWPSAAVIPRRQSTAVHFQSVERRGQRNLEGLANVRLDELPGCRAATLTFFMLTRRRRGLGERGDKILRWRHSNCTHYDACRRETVWVFPDSRDTQKCEQEDWAAISGSERIAPYRLDQSRVEAYTNGFSQTSIFIPTPFSGRTNSAQWRQEESKCLPCVS